MTHTNEYYIGLMSGTSADGIDAALVDFNTPQPKLIASHYTPYSKPLRQRILALCEKGENEIQRLGELDVMLGETFAVAANTLLFQQNLPYTAIKAIGSHGHTIRHHPHSPHRFTLQIGDPNIIAAYTKITTVADFRRKDVAMQGQGAPLVPAFHKEIFPNNLDRVIVNIGGIANITVISSSLPILAFDTGPGNTLIDSWISEHQDVPYDANGAWATQGIIHQELLNCLLADDYFQTSPPKSTGREYFNLHWLKQKLLLLNSNSISTLDVQTTLTELTARSIIESIRNHIQQGEILICGGGIHNTYLMKRLEVLSLPDFTVSSTQKYGVDPDFMEAMAFAWLARQTLLKQTGNLPSVTGAKEAVVLGGIYLK